MTTRIATAELDETVAEVRERLAAQEDDIRLDVDAIVAVDRDGRLVADVSVLDLFVSRDGARVHERVGSTDTVSVHVDATLEEVVNTLIDSRRTSLVVVDDDRVPRGRIMADDVIDALVPGRGRRLRVHVP